jgi:hypothetical protein
MQFAGNLTFIKVVSGLNMLSVKKYKFGVKGHGGWISQLG